MDITRLGIDISDCCNYLDSNKVTERKRRITELKQLLENPKSVELLNENSDKERGLCWDNVFLAIHRCLLKVLLHFCPFGLTYEKNDVEEIDRLTEDEKKRGKLLPATEAAVRTCCGLQILVVTQANTGTPHLSCHELFSCILQVLEEYSSNAKGPFILEAYINLLGHALSSEKYWGEIDFDIWKALLEVCISLLKEEISEKMKATIISVTNVIILQGGRMTSLVLKSKTLLLLFPEIFDSLVPSRYPQVELRGIQLSHTMCIEFGKEFRLTVDKFMDDILPCIMKLNGNRVSSDALFKDIMSGLLMEIVSVKTLKSNWQKEASSLMTFVNNELADISRHKLCFSKVPKVITLGVKLAKYLIKEKSNGNDFYESEPKRRRRSTCIGGVLDNLNLYSHCPWPWLCYLDCLLEKAPEVVVETDIIPLMDYFLQNLTQSNDQTCLQYMTTSSLRLLNILKGRTADKTFNDFLNTLWTTAIRCASHSALIEVGLTLVSGLLSVDDWINTDSAMTIIGLYLDGKIGVTKTSLTTLSQLSSAGFLSTTDIRINLIHWYWKGEMYSSETLLSIILRSKFPRTLPSHHSDFPPTEMEHFHLICMLGVIPELKPSSSTVSQEDVIEDKIVSMEFMNQLPRKLHEVTSLHHSLNLNSSLLSILDSFKKYNITVATRLTDILRTAVCELLTHVKESLLDTKTENPLPLITEATEFFEELAKFPNIFITCDDSEHLLNILLEILRTQHVLVCGLERKPSMKLIDIDSHNEESLKEAPPIKILHAILTLTKSYTSEDKTNTYIRLIDFCKSSVSLTSKSGFQIVSILLHHILNSKVGSKDLIKNVISLTTKLCNYWFMYYEEVLQVLQIIFDTIIPLFEFDKRCELKELVHRLLSSFYQRITKKRYGPEIIVKYISVLAHISQCNPEGVHRIDLGNGQKQDILYNILEFLNSPFHQVRITTSEHITKLFNGETLTFERETLLNRAFSNILSCVSSLFLVKEGKSPDEVKEEALNRTCCVLKIYLGLICSSPMWRRKALYELFNIVAMKNVSPAYFDKLHNYLEKSMKIENSLSFFEQNLDYILVEWYKNHKCFKKMPYLLLKHERIEDFYTEYRSIIVPIFLENSDISSFEEFCISLNSTTLEVATDCFPEILSCLIPKLGADLQVAAEFHGHITQILGQNIKELMSKELKRVLLNVFMKLSDSDYFGKLCGSNITPLPTATPFNITSKGIESALGYIQRTTPEPKEFLLVFLCNNYPCYIQYILHNLVSHVHLATTKEIRSLCFLQFIALVDILILELAKIKSMSGFLVRQTFHSLLHFISTDIALPALQYLHRFMCITLHTSTALIDYFIGIVYPVIFNLSQGKDPLAHVATKIIKLLLESEVNLPSLPLLLPPKETVASLSEEINTILQRQAIDFQALNRFFHQLGESHEELSALYEEVKNSKYSTNDCAASPIHKLISKLVTLATSSDNEIKVCAAQCLGSIGPRNLNTLALQPDLDKEPPALAKRVVSLLLPLLVDSDLETCESAVTAIIDVLETKEGLQAYDDLGDLEKTFLTPFIYHNKKPKSFSKDYSFQKLAWASFQEAEGQSQGWALWSGCDHSKWVRMLVSRLLDSFNCGFLPLLAPIAAKEVKVSEELLPYIVEIIIENSELCPKGLLIVQRNICCFFDNHYRLHCLGNKKEDGSSIYFNRKSVQCMLSIVNFCRIKTASLTQEEWMNNLKKLNVNFLHVAHAAQFCRAYFTSLLYAEIWTEFVKQEIEMELPKYLMIAPLDLICRRRPEEGFVILNLLWENYKEIGESDSVESCARLLIGDPKARMRYFKEMGSWQQLIREAEIENDQEALSHGLLMSGMFMSASHVHGYGWKAAWRLMQWDIEQPQKENENFSSLHYSALRSILHLKDKSATMNFLDSARKLVLDDLAHASLEVAASVYLPLAKLQLISELERWITDQEVNLVIPEADWIHVEPILMQRGLLSGSAEQWLSTAKIARNSSSLLISQRLLNKIKNADVAVEMRNEAKFEEALIQWESGSQEAAKFLLKHLLSLDPAPLLKSKCLLKYGKWMSETKSQGAKEIIENYFEKAANLSINDKERLEAAECLARFSDSEFQRLDRYLSSTEYENKVSQMRDTSENLKALKSCPSSQLNLEERKSSKIYQCNLAVDEAEIKTIRKEHSEFLRLAVREYLFSLQYDTTTSDKMFRFVSLWLSNNVNQGLNEEVKWHLDKVPSYRFMPVFPQLCVRMSMENDDFSLSLTSLLERCSIDHPHHCLWHLLALANAEMDQPKSDNPPPPRVQRAIKLLNHLFKNPQIGTIVKTMQDLACAYISFANLELPKGIRPGEDYKIPKNDKLREMKGLTHITSATVTIPVNKSANYSNIPGLLRFEEVFQIAAGINKPKRIKALCTDGKSRTELVKGQDDIRQDALMQQVFSVLNTLLEADLITSRRRLNIRTYKVVPMTQKSGVIEWCSNTEPLGMFLSKAHARHRPNDLSQIKCKRHLEDVAQSSHEEKLEMFQLICSKFKPVMRHFFLERYLTPGVWYEKRLAYTRSVATNSMIGYVMGIGDRHVFNILIDNETAEVIHIDFGISFELGTILPTPETVPFRLTRDIEDGMGITGIEGAFRRCCEETMRVMRKKSEPIVTTLEALLYDPLYSWSVKKPRSEQSQQSIPDISVAETNKLAERFLQRLKLKLEGCEEGGVSSIEAQVRNLILEAKDPSNLCRLFRGWQAYL